MLTICIKAGKRKWGLMSKAGKVLKVPDNLDAGYILMGVPEARENLHNSMVELS